MDEAWWGITSYLWLAEIASFSSRDFIQSNKYDTFWNVVSTRYIYVLFLWVIAVLDFRHFEIYKNLAIPTKKSFHHSGGIPVEFHWSHGKLLENDWSKWNFWNSSEIPLEFQQFIILTPVKFHL